MGDELQSHIDRVDEICLLIENEQEYTRELAGYLPALKEIVNFLLTFAQDPSTSFYINEQFVITVLKDVLYGMEHQDSVILLDTLRYGLLAIYSYSRDELQSEEEG